MEAEEIDSDVDTDPKSKGKGRRQKIPNPRPRTIEKRRPAMSKHDLQTGFNKFHNAQPLPVVVASPKLSNMMKLNAVKDKIQVKNIVQPAHPSQVKPALAQLADGPVKDGRSFVPWINPHNPSAGGLGVDYFNGRRSWIIRINNANDPGDRVPFRGGISCTASYQVPQASEPEQADQTEGLQPAGSSTAVSSEDTPADRAFTVSSANSS